jgi:hypothetical protein
MNSQCSTNQVHLSSRNFSYDRVMYSMGYLIGYKALKVVRGMIQEKC